MVLRDAITGTFRDWYRQFKETCCISRNVSHARKVVWILGTGDLERGYERTVRTSMAWEYKPNGNTKQHGKEWGHD